MVTMYDVEVNKLIVEASKLIKAQNIEVPAFVPFVKTGVHKERAPVDPDWWFVRCAAILRTVAIRGPVGCAKLRTKYGGRKNCGVKPDHVFKGSGAVIRNALQALEKLELIKKVDDKNALRKGRILAPAGQKLLDQAAKIVSDSVEVKK